MFRCAAISLSLALSTTGCTVIGKDTYGIDRWSVEPSPVEDADLALIVAQLPAAVDCVRGDQPEKCGIGREVNSIRSLDKGRRNELFADGPVVINYESRSDDDNASVTFVGGKGRNASGVMSFRRHGGAFVLTKVSVLIID